MLHWQEFEWLNKKKADKSKETNTPVTTHIVLLDFGDGQKVKGHGQAEHLMHVSRYCWDRKKM